MGGTRLSLSSPCMNTAPFFVQHRSPQTVLLGAAPVRGDVAPRATRNATVAFTAHSAAAAPPELRRDTGAARPRQAVPQKAASGVRLYGVAVPLADDPGKVCNINISRAVAPTGFRRVVDPSWLCRMTSVSMRRCARHPHHASAARQACSLSKARDALCSCSCWAEPRSSRVTHCTAGRSA